jgi:hypothetical protein
VNGKAHQGVIALLAVVGAGASPPVTPTTAPRKWMIGSMRSIATGKVR